MRNRTRRNIRRTVLAAEVVAAFGAEKKYGAGLYECDVDGDRVRSIMVEMWSVDGRSPALLDQFDFRKRGGGGDGNGR